MIMIIKHKGAMVDKLLDGQTTASSKDNDKRTRMNMVQEIQSRDFRSLKSV